MRKESLVSKELSDEIIKDIRTKINPSVKIVFLKIFVIHLFVSFLTLGICPQLGVSTFKTHVNIIDALLPFGHTFCDFFCGFFFTSSSMLTAFFILSRDEIRVVKYNKLYCSLMFALPSFGILLMFNPQLFVEFSFLWVIGVIFGTVSTIELGSRILRFI